MSDAPAKIDFSRQSSVWCLCAVVTLAAGILLFNPIVLSFVIKMSITRSAYLLFLDALLATVIVFCLRYLRWGQKRDGILAIGLMALLPLAMILIEPAIIAAYRTFGPTTAQEAAIHEPDALLGWKPVPGARARHVSDGDFDVSYVIDAQGRKQIPTHPGASQTLLFFGDSVVFGHGVANDETALNLVAETLGNRANVVNYGVMGYGIEQMFMRLRENKDEVHPGDVVIFAPISADLTRNLIDKAFVCWIYERNFAEARSFPILDNGEWRAAPIDQYCPLGDLPIAWAQHYLMARQAPALAPKLAANADVIFAMAAALAKERGAAFFLLFLVGADECKSGAYYFDLDRLETPFTSLMPSCPEDPAALRFAIDPHYNEAGQRWLAAAILDFLERNVLRAAPDDHTM